MKKIIISIACMAILSTQFGCAVMFGGRIDDCQKKKPVAGQPKRDIRWAAFMADLIIYCPGLLLDFATGAIYVPCPPAPVTPAK